MTYYEVVKYLDELIIKPIDENYISELNNFEISLEGNRYYRFIGQINYVLTERLRNCMDNIIDKLDVSVQSKESLILELSNIHSEVEFLKKIISIKQIKEENKNEFIKSIIKNNNELLEKVKLYFSDEEYLRIIDGYKLKEV